MNKIKYFLLLFLFPLCVFATTKISVIGDSISIGLNATNRYGFVQRLQDRYISESKDIVILNRSYGGALTDTLFLVGLTTVFMDHPDYIVIFLGINDVGANTPQATLYSNFSNMMYKCTGNCTRIVLGGVNSAAINPGYNTVLANVYSALISTYNPYPVMLLGTDVLPYCSDGVHPNDTGHQMIADNLYNVFHILGVY